MIIPSDKTSNNFLVPAPQYKILLDRETQKDHKRGKEENVEKVNVEHGKIVKSFQKRYSKHMSSIEKPIPTNSTTLSTHYLKEKSAGKNPSISWKFLKTNIPNTNPVSEICRLCLCEKFQILYEPKMATLNSRSEIFSACRHKKYELLVPPDPKSQGG